MVGLYRPRIVDAELRNKLGSVGAVVIEGPKASGKTATARQQSRSEVLLDVDVNARQAASIEPSLILEGATPRLLDEWQTLPSIWNHVRRAVDDRQRAGQFILTGSAAAADDVTRHTGAGRISRILMRPMSLAETGHSSGTISLRSLLASGEVGPGESALAFHDLLDQSVRGGWPGILDVSQREAQQYVRDYLDEIRRTDIRSVDGVRRHPDRIQRLLQSLARNVATEASLATLAADTGGADGPLDVHTVRDYLTALGRLFIIEDQPSWSTQLRSRDQMRKAAKRHFVDPSLAAAALRADPGRLLADLNLFGLLFESLVVRDLRVYAQGCDAVVRHYRDNKGLEIDAIVETTGGAWAAFEVKLGGEDHLDQAARNLLKFNEKVDTSRLGPPAKLGVITSRGYAYERPDGVAVVPIGMLGP